jgi:hypothetical protein
MGFILRIKNMSEKFAIVFFALTSEHLDVCEKDKLGSTF